MDNLYIYNAVREVPPEAQKEFNNGRFKGTDINPMWRIKKLTEIFGAAGIGWYTGDIVERCEQHGDVTTAIVNLNLYVKVNGEWSKPIYGTGGNMIRSLKKKDRNGNPIDPEEVVSDEGYKMAYTDALSVACKALGIGADVYYAKDKTKYTGADEPTDTSKPTICSDCNQPIMPTTKRDGSWWSVRDITAYTEKRFGRCLCAECSRKALAAEKEAEKNGGVQS